MIMVASGAFFSFGAWTVALALELNIYNSPGFGMNPISLSVLLNRSYLKLGILQYCSMYVCLLCLHV